jgi:hypothetical protein
MNYRRLTKDQKVTYEVAQQRILDYFAQLKKRFKRPMTLSPRHIADVVWPGHKMRAYGAAGAVGHYLRRMEKDGLMERVWADRLVWDWRPTLKGLKCQGQ